MIFITLGSQKFQFNRLLQAVDELIEKGVIEDEVFAQVGYSDYEPKHFEYKQFLDREEFATQEGKCDILITHGGTGAIIGAVKKGKKVIAVPRLAKYGEHVDDHQIQLIAQFKGQNLICGLDDAAELEEGLKFVKEHEFDTYQSNTKTIIESIERFIEGQNLIMQKEAIIVGWINKGKPADCGETMKNQLCIKKLESFGVKCYQIDFKNWRKHPWVFLQLGWDMLTKRKATLIFSTSVKNVYPLMKVMKKIKWKGNTVNWVIGGNLGQQVQKGVFDAGVIDYIKHTLVESRMMVEQLSKCGVTGVQELPNFKPINYYPAIPEKYPNSNRPLRLVFLSRIMPDKGCDYILEAARLLNEEGLEDKFVIDFYGKIADEYKAEFEKKTLSLSNVNYKGFLNLRVNEGYDSLSDYDLMLFPTYWRGEGFAGIFIDAFIAGLPIIATDWAHNKAFLEEGKTAKFIPVHDAMALKTSIKDCIEGKYDFKEMSLNCQKEAVKYNVDNVVTEKLLTEIGII